MNLNDTAGILTSPPASSSQSQCFWKLRTQSKNASGILLTFDRFLLPDTPNCSSDYLAIYNGPSSDAPYLGRYCGLMTGETVVSNGTALYLQFYSSSNEPPAGFQIQYESVYLGKAN